jgi:hypothetical protein
MLDQLESGPWPSFVTDIKRQAEKNDACWDILGQLELSYEDKITHWKHGGIVGVFGYGGGISDMAVELSAVILTLPKSSPVLPISIPFESTSPRVNSTAQIFCARLWEFGTDAVPV